MPPMTKEQKQALERAWRLHHKIQDDLRKLALLNPPLAYGCIRTAQTMIDMIMIRRVGEKLKNDGQKGKEKL